MEPKVCCFCGHREIHEDFHEITKSVEDNIEYLIRNFNVQYFLSGGMGEFDELCENTVLRLKRKFSHIMLNLIAVNDKSNVGKIYDKVICPEFDSSVSIIVKKNRIMVDQSDFVLAYVYNRKGGARITYEYAKLNSNRKIINLCKHKNMT